MSTPASSDEKKDASLSPNLASDEVKETDEQRIAKRVKKSKWLINYQQQRWCGLEYSDKNEYV